MTNLLLATLSIGVCIVKNSKFLSNNVAAAGLSLSISDSALVKRIQVMFRSLFASVVLLSLPTTAMAGFSGIPADASFLKPTGASMVTLASGSLGFQSVQHSGTLKKSERQKCLDMMLPQDGADCLKKLEAKKKKNN